MSLSQAGATCSLEPGGRWWAAVPEDEWPQAEELRRELMANWHTDYGDRRQELVVIGIGIGIGIDDAALRAGRERCLLTDAELATGPWAWSRLDDPLPPVEDADPAPDASPPALALAIR